jgi:acyl-coenzyme A synthetase/AMP-(fatty) acid ligase
MNLSHCDALMPLLDAIAAAAADDPARPAIRGPGGKEVSYGRLDSSLAGAPAASPRRLALGVTGTAQDVCELLRLSVQGHSVLTLDAAATRWERDRAARRFAEAEPWGAGPSLGLCTSGTNGLPRVVDLDWPAVLANAASFADAAGYGADDVIWCSTPLPHLYGLAAGVIAGLLSGATLVIGGGAMGPGEFADRLVGEQATVLLSVPFLLRRYLTDLERTPHAIAAGRLRATIAAGEPVAAELVAGWRRHGGGPLLSHYGLTEGGHITLAGGDPGDGVGAPLPDVEVRVGADGAIRVRRRPPARPYRVLGEEPPAGGWRETGDQGYLDAAGNLHVTGRSSDRINVAGRKVDPVEVEQRLRDVDGVRDCAVAGASLGGEEQVVAFVALDAPLPDGRLRAELRERLSAHKLPRRFVRVQEIPRTATGKIRRGQLIAELHQPAA